MPRSRAHPDRTSIEVGVGGSSLALGGILVGFFVAAKDHWLHAADLTLLAAGLACLLFGVYVFGQYYVGALPSLPEPKSRRRTLPSSPFVVPEFMTARGQVNSLITEGENIRKWMPTFDGSSDLALALMGSPPTSLRVYKQVAGWEARVAEKVGRLAPSYTSLFTTDEVPLATSALLGPYMDARIVELKEILKKL